MVTRTFLSKVNTIYSDRDNNYGLHPIASIHYGQYVSRILLYFDTDRIIEEYGNSTGLKHTLKMTNCGSIGGKKMEGKERAVSFDIILFKLPKEWDRGVGFDDDDQFWIRGKSCVSKEASNWHQSKNNNPWDEEGVYSNDTLSAEYDKFGKGMESIVIGRQHFDSGSENINIDISDYVNKIIAGETKNYGLGIAFSPLTESTFSALTENESSALTKNNLSEKAYYTNFFTDKTNTFYQPVIETRCSTVIRDDRYQFFLNKTNHLYLYSKIDGNLTDLDEMPVCTIEGTQYPVSKISKGTYCANVKLSSNDYSKDTILYDEWSNLKYNGDSIDNAEMEFVTKSSGGYFSVDDNLSVPSKITVTLNGISDDEKINIGDKRIVKVTFNKAYEKNSYELVNNAYYRLYVKDGNKELTVIDWDVIDVSIKNNRFVIDTKGLLPNRYHIDIKVINSDEVKIFKDELTFKIVNDITELKR